MYVLSLSDIASFDLKNAPDFVAFWNRFYGYEATLPEEKKRRIDYFSELKLEGDLSEQNVRRLLRWKDPRFLTDPKKGTNEPNKKVRRVLQNLSVINSFRRSEKTEDEMRHAAENIFQSPKIVWRAFLLHIAKPHAYPIADQNVFRSYCLHTDVPEPQTWQSYTEYSNYFGEIAATMKIARTPENVRELKKIDNALYVFGQFLASYYKPQPLATSRRPLE
jgi:hypothetical protein